MHTTTKTLTALIAFAGLVAAGLVDGQEVTAPKVGEPVQGPIEVLTRGPLHEAFAQPLQEKAGPGEIVPKEPPAPIPEQPPEQQPDLANTQWIPGHWSWDTDRQEFVWISGVYRVAPQGRTYVPGYWAPEGDGWRWVSGFWADSQRPDVAYAPEPPAPLAVGPTAAPPDQNSVFIPGVWVYDGNRFVWRPGYWSAAQLGRVWISPYYVWTPNGYLFVDGYWDVPYDARGMVFAPVAFNRPLWNDPNWSYRPNYVVSLALLFDSAFVRGGSFYYGNYYNPNYARLGYRPWYNGIGRYDPGFAYYGWQNQRTNPNWVANTQLAYANRSAGRASVPPTTFAQQASLKTPAVVRPLNQVGGGSVRLVNATPAQIEHQKQIAQRTRDLSVQRKAFDSAVLNQPRPAVGQTRSFPINGAKFGSHVQTFPTSPKGQGSSPSIINGGGYRYDRPGGNTPFSGGPKITNQNPYQAPGPNRTFTPQSVPRVNSVPHTTPKTYTLPSTHTAPKTYTLPSQTTPRTYSPPSVPRVNSVPHTTPRTYSAPATIRPSAAPVHHPPAAVSRPAHVVQPNRASHPAPRPHRR